MPRGRFSFNRSKKKKTRIINIHLNHLYSKHRSAAQHVCLNLWTSPGPVCPPCSHPVDRGATHVREDNKLNVSSPCLCAAGGTRRLQPPQRDAGLLRDQWQDRLRLLAGGGGAERLRF